MTRRSAVTWRSPVVILRGRKVVPGTVAGPALVSHEAISGCGGIDPAKGLIIEPRHELFGQSFTGKILTYHLQPPFAPPNAP